ncbi:MAG: hypothetical protein QOH17_4997 [Pseudonocardiales bacterium]|nr:hypothetical protein [Pseudonocardiales bacterium]
MKRFVVPIACILIQLVSVRAGTTGGESVWAAALSAAAGVVSGLALLRRGRSPDAVLATAVVSYLVQVTLGAPVLPASVAVATETLTRRMGEPGTERHGRRRLGELAVALIVVTATVAATGSSFLAAPFGMVLLTAAFLGQYRSARIARDAARQQELVVAERLRIARDLHDVVGHGLGAITVQAGAARLAIAAGDEVKATQALTSIEAAGRGVLREVRWLVGLLRETGEPPGLSDLPELISAARRSGLAVDFRVEGELISSGRESGEAAYRIIQEALTNVVRHSAGTAAMVRVRVDTDIELLVRNPGSPNVANFAEGNGLRGVRERAAAVAGHVAVGPDAEGWTVRAELPLAVRSR